MLRRLGKRRRAGMVGGPQVSPLPTGPCRNCGMPTPGRFCPECGQRSAQRVLSAPQMVHDGVEDHLSLDARLPRTLVSLLFRPGFLTAEYLAGRIVRYVSPLRLYLSASLLFFVLLPFVAGFDRLWQAMEPRVNQASSSETAHPERHSRTRDRVGDASQPGSSLPGGSGEFVLTRSGIDTTKVGGLLRPLAVYYVRQEAKLNSMSPREGSRVLYGEVVENVPRLVFLLLPVFALFLKGLYPRRLYVEHFVFALHFHTFLFLGATVALVGESMTVLMLLSLLALIYLFLAQRRVYQQGWRWLIAKHIMLLIAYWCASVVIFTSAIFVAVLTA